MWRWPTARCRRCGEASHSASGTPCAACGTANYARLVSNRCLPARLPIKHARPHWGEVMTIHHLAVSLLLCFGFVLRGAEAADAKDWPMYNGDVLGWRHNAGETALSKANVARLEEKWRFPPKGADFEIGAVHATPAVVNGYVYFGTVTRPAFYKLTPDGKVKWCFH